MIDFQKLINFEQEKQEKEKENTENFPLQKTMLELEKELNRDIFLDDKAIKSYSSTKIKARNFLTNVSYNRINKVDYKNEKFVIDCFTFLILYLNPFYLERKFETVVEREFVNTLWAFLMPNNLYDYISLKDNVETLNKIKVKFQDAKQIMIGFIQQNNGNMDVLIEFLEKNAILYQFLYGNLFPKCFSRINDYGIKAKTSFNSYFENFNIQKKVYKWHNDNLQIKEEPQEYDNASPINMTELNEKNEENVEKTEVKKELKKNKRKINNETKEQKREVKKQRLLQQLNENTEKLKRLKKKKIN